MVALYLPGDASASGTGFGSAIISEEKGVLYQAGMWETSYAQESSNFREASNLVKRLTELVWLPCQVLHSINDDANLKASHV
eukprot:scaffold23400_cov72-Skeletonema_dohrnii-CCMP3373.AAC.3